MRCIFCAPHIFTNTGWQKGPNMNDAQLIESFCSGNTRAFNTLVDRWQHRIHCVAYRYFNNHDEAREITQKTFIRVYKKLRALDDPDRFAAWIYRIVNNLCLDETRRADRWRSAAMDKLENEPKDTATEIPDRPVQQKEWEALLQQALQQLPSEQRIAIIMKEYEDLTFKEIATILNVSPNTVKSRVYYGLNTLRGIFDQWNINKEALYYD